MSENTIKVIESLGVIVGLVILRWLILRAVHRQVDDPDVWFRTRRIATYTTTVIALFSLAWIWLDAFSSLPTFLGLLSAGIAIALSDVLKNMAGWFYIMSRRPFRIGDRVEVSGSRGDVIDIRLFRFTLMEIGNWVQADQSTGRLVHVPNGMVFTNSVANFTEGFPYVWHEVAVLVTFESDWREARDVIQHVIDEAGVDVDDQAREHMRAAARAYQIKIGKLTPTVYMSVQDSGVLLTARLLTEARRRRAVDQQVWEGILDGFAASEHIELAYPTIRTYLPDAIRTSRVEGEPSDGGATSAGE